MSKNKVIIAFLALIIGLFAFYQYILLLQIKGMRNDNPDIVISNLKILYEENPEIFKFDSDGKVMMSMEEIFNSSDDVFLELTKDKDGNDCIGYVTITKLENDIAVDVSHMCDMINE